MNLLKSFEKKIEQTLEGFFVKGFKSGVQPVELAKKLAREMEGNRTVSVSKVYVPNQYTLYLSKGDKRRLEPFKPALVKELQSFLVEQARKDGLSLPSSPQIEIVEDKKLALGEVNVTSKLMAKEEAKELSKEEAKEERLGETSVISLESLGELESLSQRPAVRKRANLILLGKTRKRIVLEKEVTSLGRLETNDVALEDPNVSRLHAEIRQEKGSFFLVDLASTNGTFLNDKPVKKEKLKDKDTISLGETILEFRET